MAKGASTLADLRSASFVDSLEIVAAIDVYMVDPATGPYSFASGKSVEIPALVGPTSECEKLSTKSGPNARAIRTKVDEIVMAAYPTPERPVPFTNE